MVEMADRLSDALTKAMARVDHDALESLLPLGVLVLISLSVSYVVLKVHGHLASTNHHENTVLLPGLLIALVSGTGLTHVLMAKMGHLFNPGVTIFVQRLPTLLSATLAAFIWWSQFAP